MVTADDRGRPEVARIPPLSSPLDAVVDVPGSKSLVNRVLPVAAMAVGKSTITNVGFGDDTEAMLDALVRLGVPVGVDRRARAIRLDGVGGALCRPAASIDVRQSGTTARFLPPIIAASGCAVTIDGDSMFRRRPMTPLVDGLRQLGASLAFPGDDGHLPLVLTPDRDAAAEVIHLGGDESSQFLSGVLLAAPLFANGLLVELTSPLVSVPYVEMTLSVMERFDVTTTVADDWTSVRVPADQTYRGTDVIIEPDASSASYFFAAAAITGGRVRVDGLGSSSLQGDVAFASLLGDMGASVSVTNDSITVAGTGTLHGGDFDMGQISDTAMTMAVVAPFADTPTRVTGVGFIRRKESDRIANVVTELRRCGVDATEEDDGFVVRPGRPHDAVIETHDDHRLAMAFALFGLVTEGIDIADPGCVSKTFPSYFDVLAGL